MPPDIKFDSSWGETVFPCGCSYIHHEEKYIPCDRYDCCVKDNVK